MAHENTEAESDRLISTAELALLLHVEPRTLAAWRQRGIGPVPVRLTSRVVRYRASDVREYIAGRTSGGKAAA